MTKPFDFSPPSGLPTAPETTTDDPAFAAWLPAVTPAFHWDWAHLAYVRGYLDRVTSGEITRLMLFLPPRHGKTEMTTVRYPVYRLECDPDLRVIVGAYNQTLANKFSRKSRRIARERLTLNDERTAVEDWETSGGGGYRAVGVGGGITGQGGDLIIIDDPVKSREEANSEAYRDRVWDWYRDDLYTRLEPGGSIILIMTRWHDDDLAGRLLEDAKTGGDQWTVVSLPAEAEVDDPLGRPVGAALCPERYDLTALKRTHSVLGASYYALYQQHPQPADGGMFKREWWQRYRELPELKTVAQFCDSAFKDGVGNDYSVIATWGSDGLGNYYLIDVWRERVQYPDLLRALHDVYARHKTRSLGALPLVIEDKASGQSALQTLRRPLPTMDGTILPALPALAWKVKAGVSKEARAESVTPLVETRHVFLPHAADWVEDFIGEHERFPASVHDDMVDTTSMALAYLSRGPVQVFSV